MFPAVQMFISFGGELEKKCLPLCLLNDFCQKLNCSRSYEIANALCCTNRLWKKLWQKLVYYFEFVKIVEMHLTIVSVQYLYII